MEVPYGNADDLTEFGIDPRSLIHFLTSGFASGKRVGLVVPKLLF